MANLLRPGTSIMHGPAWPAGVARLALHPPDAAPSMYIGYAANYTAPEQECPLDADPGFWLASHRGARQSAFIRRKGSQILDYELPDLPPEDNITKDLCQ